MTDAEPFEAFVRRYQDMVFATAVRLLGNVPDAEDAAQTVFLRAFERYAQLAVSPAAGGWLKTTTRNVCFNHLSRYRARWKFFSELDTPGADTTFESTLESQVSRALGLEAGDRHERLEQAVRTLPDHQRVPLVLFHFEELSYQQIADALKVSVEQGEDRHPSRPRGAQAPPDGRCTRITTNLNGWRIASCGGCRRRAHRIRCCRGSWPRSRRGRSVRGTRARGLRGRPAGESVSLVPIALLAYALWSWSLPPAPPTVVAATDASRVVWSALIEPLLPYILLVVLLMGVVCAAFGLALNYVLLERAEQR